MKGLTADQYKEILEFVQKYHSFAQWDSEKEVEEKQKQFPSMKEHGMSIKYVDACYDSRGKDIWAVKFRGFGELFFSTNAFNILTPRPKNFPFDNLYDWIMAYLKEEWSDKKIIEKVLSISHKEKTSWDKREILDVIEDTLQKSGVELSNNEKRRLFKEHGIKK